MKRSLYDLVFTDNYIWERNGFIPSNVVSIHADNLQIPLDGAVGNDWYKLMPKNFHKEGYWKDFPCVMPPFTRCFIEYWGGIGRLGRIGVMVQKIPYEFAGENIERIFSVNQKITDVALSVWNTKQPKWLLILDTFGETRNLIGKADHIGLTTMFPIDEHGDMISSIKLSQYKDDTPLMDMLNFIKKQNRDADSLSFELSARLYTKAIFALSLMNCKNTELIDHDPTPLTKKQKKQGQQVGTVYKTIKVHPMRKVYQDNKEEIPTEANEMPLHIIRGHFKDFRNGAGLFGKFRDIFWWEQQVRGKPENGRIIKDYDVHPE